MSGWEQELRDIFDALAKMDDHRREAQWEAVAQKFSMSVDQIKQHFEKYLANRKTTTLQFSKPKVDGGYFEFVCDPAPSQVDGFFPLGAVSLLCGSSGTNKTTILIQMCQAQHKKEPFLGHATHGRDYLILMMDRDDAAMARTLKRMNIAKGSVPLDVLPSGHWDREAAQMIIKKIEEQKKVAQVLVIEGLDMMVTNEIAKEVVTEFMKYLQEIARHFHIAIIGTMGSPKVKAKDGYIAKRDQIAGSAAWSRLSETVVAMQFPEGDDTSDRRLMSVLPRNARAESFSMILDQGLLRIQTEEELEKQQQAPKKKDVILDWVRRADGYFTRRDVETGTGQSHTAVHRWIKDALTKKWIFRKAGPRSHAEEYYWNNENTNPLITQKVIQFPGGEPTEHVDIVPSGTEGEGPASPNPPF